MNTQNSTKITDLLSRKAGTRGEVIATEKELYKEFQEAKCVTKTDMVMYLYNKGFPSNSIAKTLLAYGILSPKSSYQHVRSTIERKTARKS